MSTLPGRPLTWKPKGLSDADDATNAFAGAMQKLANLIPSPSTRNQFVPRPAADQLTNFTGSGLDTPGVPNAILTVGTIAYGMCPDTHGTNNGKDVPFAYNFVTNTFETIAILGALPTSPAATGAWTPPTMAVVGNRVIVTHPGFPGGSGAYFGWLDIGGFSDATHTGDTHTNTTIDNLSANVLLAGWQVGMKITGTNIPANTTIVAIATGGLALTLSQATTGTTAGVTLTVAGGTATAPIWGSGNTNLNPLTAVPVAVAQFNGRAYFAVTNGVTFSDAGNAVNITNATQRLTFQNGLPVTSLSGFGMFSNTLGSIIQCLIAFQGDSQAWQIQGDPSFTAGLTNNGLLAGVGTLSPLSICQTPYGLAFVAPDGVRILDTSANFSDPIGGDGQGVAIPFLYAVTPSRTVAAYNQGVYRITVQNGNDPNEAFQEYWLDMVRKIWTGPHSFPYAVIAPMQHEDNAFIGAGVGIAGKLWHSDVNPDASSSYSENGTALTWDWQTCLLPDNEQMAENAMVETAVGMTLSPGSTVNVVSFDEAGNTLGQVQVQGPSGSPGEWDVGDWDVMLWDTGASYFRQYPIQWTQLLVFKQMQLQINGASQSGVAIGNLYMRYDPQEFLMQNIGIAI